MTTRDEIFAHLEHAATLIRAELRNLDDVASRVGEATSRAEVAEATAQAATETADRLRAAADRTAVRAAVKHDRLTEQLLAALEVAGEDGLTGTQVNHKVFGRHQPAATIRLILAELMDRGAVTATRAPGAGRTALVYHLTRRDAQRAAGGSGGLLAQDVLAEAAGMEPAVLLERAAAAGMDVPGFAERIIAARLAGWEARHRAGVPAAAEAGSPPPPVPGWVEVARQVTADDTTVVR